MRSNKALHEFTFDQIKELRLRGLYDKANKALQERKVWLEEQRKNQFRELDKIRKRKMRFKQRII